MKTLREYMDQLDEISRRDFLKGAGAAAVAGATGGAKAQWVKDPDYKDPMDDVVYRSWSNRSTNGLATLQFNQNARQLHLKHNNGRWLPQSQWPSGRIRVDNNPPIEVMFTITNIPNLVYLSVPGSGDAEPIVRYVLSAKDRILIDVTKLTRSDQLILSFDANLIRENIDQELEEASSDAANCIENPIAKIDRLFRD